MAGLPPSCLLLGENNASLRALIKGGEGDFSPRTAGRQRASHPPLSLRVHTQTHTLQLTGTGHGLNIYQAHANKRLLKKIMILPCLNYMTALFFHLGLTLVVRIRSLTKSVSFPPCNKGQTCHAIQFSFNGRKL